MRAQGRTQEFWKGGSVTNNQQGEGAGAFGGPTLVHWMMRYIT